MGTTKYVAFLRGINVGGHAILAMSELKTLCEKLGYQKVRTYIQSGNVIFESALTENTLAQKLEAALGKKIGKPVSVVVRTVDDLAVILKKNPFPKAEPAKVGVMFFARPIQKDFLSGVSTSTGEEVKANKREIYIYYPNGMGRFEAQATEAKRRWDCSQHQHNSKNCRFMRSVKELPILSFPTARTWHAWLDKNHSSSSGVQLRIFKKGSGQKSVSYDEALDEALCYGWIDGQKSSYDEASWIQKFTPRRSKSIWSKRNKEHVARLIEEKRMKPAGLKQVEAAKIDGRWDQGLRLAEEHENPRRLSERAAKK